MTVGIKQCDREAAAGEKSIDLSKEYRVDPSMIRQIVRRVVWKNV